MNFEAAAIRPGIGGGSTRAPACSALSAWRASSIFICRRISRLRWSPSGSDSRCSSRWASTWRSVSTTKPRFQPSPRRPAAAPMAKLPAYHSGLNRLGRLSSSRRRSAHQARWSVSSCAASSRWARVAGSRATAAWPKYRPCAQTSPTWLIRIRPAAWRRSARGSTGSSACAGQGRCAGGSPRVVSSARWASTRMRSSGDRWRETADMEAGRDGGMPGLSAAGGGLPNSPPGARHPPPRRALRRVATSWAVASLAVAGYDPASVLHPSQREAKFRPGNPVPESARPTARVQMKTFIAKNETVQRDWYLVDATGKTLGRLAAELAHRLRGKHKPVYTPHVDTGDYMVVVNADKITVTGNKLQDKMYYRFTGYIGNLKSETLAQALERHPERVIEIAVKGML